jgi:hypothetical protein
MMKTVQQQVGKPAKTALLPARHGKVKKLAAESAAGVFRPIL